MYFPVLLLHSWMCIVVVTGRFGMITVGSSREQLLLMYIIIASILLFKKLI